MINKEYAYAVIGASKDPEKYGNKVFKDLLDADYNVTPININGGELYDEKVYETVSNMPGTPDVAIMVVPPNIAMEILDELSIIGVDKVWFQPGSENESVTDKCEDLGIKYQQGACIMVERE